MQRGPRLQKVWKEKYLKVVDGTGRSEMVMVFFWYLASLYRGCGYPALFAHYRPHRKKIPPARFATQRRHPQHTARQSKHSRHTSRRDWPKFQIAADRTLRVTQMAEWPRPRVKPRSAAFTPPRHHACRAEEKIIEKRAPFRSARPRGMADWAGHALLLSTHPLRRD